MSNKPPGAPESPRSHLRLVPPPQLPPIDEETAGAVEAVLAPDEVRFQYGEPLSNDEMADLRGLLSKPGDYTQWEKLLRLFHENPYTNKGILSCRGTQAQYEYALEHLDDAFGVYSQQAPGLFSHFVRNKFGTEEKRIEGITPPAFCRLFRHASIQHPLGQEAFNEEVWLISKLFPRLRSLSVLGQLRVDSLASVVECFPTLSELRLGSFNFRDPDLESVGKLSFLRTLVLKDVQNLTTLEPLRNLENVSSFTLYGGQLVEDFSPLEAFHPTLTHLEIQQARNFSDVKLLKGFQRLKSLVLVGVGMEWEDVCEVKKTLPAGCKLSFKDLIIDDEWRRG